MPVQSALAVQGNQTNRLQWGTAGTTSISGERLEDFAMTGSGYAAAGHPLS